MKRHGRLYGQVTAFENLWRAADKAQRGKRTQNGVARFNLNRETELLQLQRELEQQSYRPGEYREFLIYEPKRRLISAAPYRDRVVHHALCSIIEPIFERTFIHDSYACRVGKGTHRAVDRFTQFSRQRRYVLKCDIRKYFPSIDHAVLKGLIRRKIRDRQVLWLTDAIIDSSNPQEPVVAWFPGDELLTPGERRHGIPIGNLTSQFFANVYLNPLDHFVKEQLRCRCYIRYCDDFVLLHDDKVWLHEARCRIEDFLAGLRLKLHPRKCQVFPVSEGTDFLGYRVFPTHRRVRRDGVTRFRRRMRRLQSAYVRDEVSQRHIQQSIQSWLGHASHADSFGLRKRLLGEFRFVGRP